MNWDNATRDQLVAHLVLHGFDADAVAFFPDALLVLRCELLDSGESPMFQHQRFVEKSRLSLTWAQVQMCPPAARRAQVGAKMVSDMLGAATAPWHMVQPEIVQLATPTGDESLKRLLDAVLGDDDDTG